MSLHIWICLGFWLRSSTVAATGGHCGSINALLFNAVFEWLGKIVTWNRSDGERGTAAKNSELSSRMFTEFRKLEL
ncbi:MAG: hypothetical protein BRC40_13655 [Cyanobacteria bacterium QH_8_48_120]|jgi:hypothetical protein|nr:MAG: hypothetical protein BRC40_13655 [Cyanobacteria bacterium QH_8_48_120]